MLPRWLRHNACPGLRRHKSLQIKNLPATTRSGEGRPHVEADGRMMLHPLVRCGLPRWPPGPGIGYMLLAEIAEPNRSRFSRAMKSRLTSAGHTAWHSP